jgi:hypothetical protein
MRLAFVLPGHSGAPVGNPRQGGRDDESRRLQPDMQEFSAVSAEQIQNCLIPA